MNKAHNIIVVILLACLLGCQSEKVSPISVIDQLKKAYDIDPTPERAKVLLDSIDSFVKVNIDDKTLIKSQLRMGADMAEALKSPVRQTRYLLPLLRLYPNDPARISDLTKLGDAMGNLGKDHISKIIFDKLASEQPGDQALAAKADQYSNVESGEGSYLDFLFDQILVNPDEFGVNKAASLKYVDAVEAMALVDPSSSGIDGYLYKAAEIARSMRTYPKALTLYDWVIDQYPDSEHAPTSLFIKGFILEQDIYDRQDEAREIYETFLTRYPNDEMAESVKFLLKNIGKSDQEILQEIEKNNPSKG